MKFTDFGTAKQNNSSTTKTASVKGTPTYMSPEFKSLYNN